MRTDIEAADEEIRRKKKIANTIKGSIGTAVGIGTTIAGGSLASKVLPFLNNLIPEDLALKGINKISPKLGNFLSQGQEAGLDLKDGFEYLKEQLQPTSQQKEPQNQEQQQSDPLQFLSGYSPELTQFIQDQLQKGQPAKAIASLAKQDQKLSPVVSKIEKDTQKDFISLLEEILGGQSFQQQPDITSMKDLMGQGTNAGQSQSSHRLANVLAQYAQIRGKR
jgi:hypothetical protein